jgi:hypothetical protein
MEAGTVTEHIFEEVKADLAEEARRALGGVEALFGHARYHDGSVTETLPEETGMGVLSVIDDDVKEYLTEGFDYLGGMAAKLKAAAPGIIAVAEASGSQTVSAAVESLAGRVLPPDVDAWLAGVVKDAIEKFGAPAAAQPAPAEPAEAPAA